MQKPSAILSPLYHRGQQHIKVEIANERAAIGLIKKVPGRKWSKTHTCWYVPHTPGAYRQLQELFEVSLIGLPAQEDPADTAPLPGTVAAMAAPLPTGNVLPANPAIRLAPENAKRLKAFVQPREKEWIEKIKTIPGRAWNEKEGYWSLPLTRTVLDKLREWSGNQLPFPPDLPADLPEDYLPKNWRQPQLENAAPPAPSPARDWSPVPKKALPDWILKPVAGPLAPPPVAVSNTGVGTGPANKDVVRAFRSPTDNSLTFLEVPAHRRDWTGFVKTLPGARWLPQGKAWSVPRTQENHDRCKAFFGEGLVVEKGQPITGHTDQAQSTHATATTEPAVPPKFAGASCQGAPQMVACRTDAQPLFREINKNGKIIKAVEGTNLTVKSIDKDWLAAYIPYDRQDWVEKIKKSVPGRSWDVGNTCWRVPFSKESLRLLYLAAKDNLLLTFNVPDDLPDRIIVKTPKSSPRPQKEGLFYQLTEKQKAAVTALEKQLTIERKAYQTIKGYRNHFVQFLYFFKETLPSQITTGQIKEYIYQRIKNDNISNSTHSGIYSALQAFYVRVLEKPEKLAQLERPPKENKLPRDLDKDEIERLFRTITNIKHKCLLYIMYSTGLRVGELVRLRLEDIDFDAKTVFVFQSKNDKDRFTVMGSKIIPMVQAYLVEHKPQHWLFEGPDGEPYTVRSVQEIFKRAREKARIKKNVSTHALRHSYATHNLAKGIDLELLRNLMGHASLKTTQIYLHITKKRLLGTPSPFDDLDI